MVDGERAGDPPNWHRVDPALVNIAQQLARLPDLLPPADPVFQRRVLARLEQVERRPLRRWWGRVVAPSLAALMVLLGLGLFTPGGRAVVAGFAARFGLGRFAVEVTPQPGADGDSYVHAERQSLANVQEAQALVDYAILTPQVLPPKYDLTDVVAISYEGMPVWIPQPFYLELEYRGESSAELHDLTLREFGLAVKEGEYIRRIRQVDFASKDVHTAEDVLVRDTPAVLVTMAADRDVVPVRRLIWQQGEVVVEMLSQVLSSEEMLSIAEHLQ